MAATTIKPKIEPMTAAGRAWRRTVRTRRCDDELETRRRLVEWGVEPGGSGLGGSPRSEAGSG
ncbi:MAG: hypothetical protein HYY16_02685 [Planctomycetes bacterium]|nr:hypothetical protein [Planctomycetota bacterium]